MHNHTWLNERVIEVPIIYHILQQYMGQNRHILEVGNVLSHYYPITHDVVDKYEIASGVINKDIVEFVPDKQYDLIVSISTLEHVGWDETPKKPQKILRAIAHLKSLLKTSGEMYITLPIGENPYLDEYLRTGQLTFDKQYNFVKTSNTKWEPTTWQTIAFAQHNHPFKFGNAMIIGWIQNEGTK